MICILYENEEWIAPLVERLGDKVFPWNFADTILDLDQVPDADVYFNKLSASAFSRGHSTAPVLGQTIVDWLEANDRRVVNGSNAVRLELSKAYQMLRLSKSGIAAPRTLCFNNLDTLKSKADSFRYPCIIKPNCSGKGLGVYKAESSGEVAKAELHTEDGLYLVQDYIEPVDKHIIRLEFIGGEFVYAVKVNTEGGFERCPADACEIGESPFSILADFEHPLVGQVQKFLKEERVEVAGVEFITDSEGDVFVYDINTSTNYNTAAESAVGISAFDRLASYLSAISS